VPPKPGRLRGGIVPPALLSHLFLLISSEHGNLLVGNVRPLHELLPPLHHRDPVGRAVSTIKGPPVNGNAL